MPKLLRLLILTALLFALQGCAALWVADKTVETAWFATKTTAKVGMTAAELTWDTGGAAVNAVSDDEGKNKGEKQNETTTGQPARN